MLLLLAGAFWGLGYCVPALYSHCLLHSALKIEFFTMATSLDSISDLMKCDHRDLLNLCKELCLPVSGSKLSLATRIKLFYDQYEVSPDTAMYDDRDDYHSERSKFRAARSNSNSSHDQKHNIAANLEKSIENISAQISDLERKIQISSLEKDISVLYENTVTKHGTPSILKPNTADISHIITANSNEPFVAKRRPRQPRLTNEVLSESVYHPEFLPDSLSDNHPQLSTPAIGSSHSCMVKTPSLANSAVHNDSCRTCSSHGPDPMIAYHYQAAKLPRCAPPVFTGDILKYNDWNKKFTMFIEQNPTLTAGEKLSYLATYTGGAVSEVVEQYTTLDDDESYAKVREILSHRYGHPHKISLAYQKRLYEWPKIPNNNAVALQRFSDMLISCRTAMTTITDLSFLNHQRENRRLKQLLPTWLQRKWNAVAIDYSNANNHEFPSFSMFVDFVHRHSENQNHPIANDIDNDVIVKSSASSGTSAKKSEVSHNASVVSGNNECNGTAPTVPPDKPATPAPQPRAPVESAPSYVCIKCKGDHRLYKCPQFKSLSPANRLAFIQKHKYCVNCLNVNHGKNACVYRLFCKLCNKRGTGHSELLHEALVGKSTDKGDASKQAVNFSSLNCHITRSKTSFIVPVYVSHKANPGNEVLTYALVDTQSQITFITDSLAHTISEPDDVKELPLSTMSSSETSDRNVYDNVIIRGYDASSKRYPLKRLNGCANIPNNRMIPSAYDLKQWPVLAEVADKFPPVLDCEVGLLIGYDHHYFSYPIRTVPDEPPDDTEDPFAVCTPLGWTMVGPVSTTITQPISLQDVSCSAHNVVLSMKVPKSLQIKSESEVPLVYQVSVKSTESAITAVPMDVVKRLEMGFNMPGDDDHSLSSLDDDEFMRILTSGICRDKDGLYCMPLPFRGGNPPVFPNNRYQALSRLKSLEYKFRDPSLFEKYDKFMQDMILSGDAEPVPLYELNAKNKWYLPHHNVVNPKKPQKVRVVFDASCSYKRCSLNSSLLSGPDLNNSLIGALTRFCERKFAVACDIEKMFYRFSVLPEHRDFLRFLWYDASHNISEYRMTKHIFGATSSPGCAEFGLLQMARDHGGTSKSAQWFLENCFYVDDGLFSCDTVEEAVCLLSDTRAICESANLHLHKLMSNCSEVLSAFPDRDLACDLKEFTGGVSGSERALGIDWDPVSDRFSFSLTVSGQKVIRRNMLKSLASLFDPLGFLSPVTLVGKAILQRCCHGFDWDDPLPQLQAEQWQSWIADLYNLECIQIPRCLKNTASGINLAELHTYADASEKGYGACCYLRLCTDEGVSCSLLFGKSRVVPLKGCTMPRLELQAAVLAAKIGNQLCKELSITTTAQYYWSDSEIVLAYIQNTKKRLKQYVRNRVQTIHELSEVHAWNYVASAENPADIASRGSSIDTLVGSMWFHGPSKLSDSSFAMTSLSPDKFDIADSDPEVQNENQVSAHCLTLGNGLPQLIDGVKTFSAAVKAVDILLHTKSTRWKSKYTSSVQSLQNAEMHLIRELQAAHFRAELDSLRSESGCVNASSPLSRLDPFIDNDGLLRVGGRLKYAELLEKERHPLIIPKKSHVTHLIVKHHHELCGHQGRGITMSFIRSAGFWIVNLSSVVSSHIYKCVDCSKLRKTTETQKMADLPSARVNPSPPFSYVGLDYFGPFEVKEKRRVLKKYGVIFTCLYSRAVHVEVCDDMTSDAFINCLRVFFALRGQVRQIYCDRGTNFIGAENELSKALRDMTDSGLKQYLEKSKCEFIFNSPSSSHMGGSWERQIRTFRNILSGVSLHTPSLDCSSIRTVFYECMNIMNSRPMTTVDSDGLDPLTPNHLIQMKTSIVLPPPPGSFDDEQYSRKRWRRVQATVDLFWSRWRSQYLAGLQGRQCWTKTRSFSVGDVVLLKDDNVCRGQWKLCRISDLIISHDGLVRRVELRVGDYSAGADSVQVSYLERPVHKLVLLIPNAEQ